MQWPQRRHLPAIILTVLFTILLSALIGVSVSLAKRTAELDRLHASREPTLTPPWDDVSPQYRLPKTIIPRHYDLFFQINLPYDENDHTIPDPFTTTGSHVTVTLEATLPTNFITLHARQMRQENQTTGYIKNISKDKVKLSKVVLDGTDTDTVDVTMVEFRSADILVVHLVQNMLVNQPYQLRIEFDGVIFDDNNGLYWSRLNVDGLTR